MGVRPCLDTTLVLSTLTTIHDPFAFGTSAAT